MITLTDMGVMYIRTCEPTGSHKVKSEWVRCRPSFVGHRGSSGTVLRHHRGGRRPTPPEERRWLALSRSRLTASLGIWQPTDGALMDLANRLSELASFLAVPALADAADLLRRAADLASLMIWLTS